MHYNETPHALNLKEKDAIVYVDVFGEIIQVTAESLGREEFKKWKEWSDELTEKVNTNLATYTSSYSAPRTTVAKAKENIVNIVDTTPKNVETQSTQIVDDALPEGEISDDDDAWVDSILNG